MGAASAKHASSFGAQTALARTDSERPVQRALALGRHRSGAKWKKGARSAYHEFIFACVTEPNDLAEGLFA